MRLRVPYQIRRIVIRKWARASSLRRQPTSSSAMPSGGRSNVTRCALFNFRRVAGAMSARSLKSVSCPGVGYCGDPMARQAGRGEPRSWSTKRPRTRSPERAPRNCTSYRLVSPVTVRARIGPTGRPDCFDLWIGGSSAASLAGHFEVKRPGSPDNPGCIG